MASGMLDYANNSQLTEITHQACEVLGTEIAAIKIILEREQWMLAASGLVPITVPREISFCTHVVAHSRPLIVSDATHHPFFVGHPFVAPEGEAREGMIRSYCGVPITTADGYVAGALCGIDSHERAFSPKQVLALAELARNARAVMLPDSPPEELVPALWFSEDPLSARIRNRAPVRQHGHAQWRRSLHWFK